MERDALRPISRKRVPVMSWLRGRLLGRPQISVAEIAVLGPVTSSTLLALNRISERSDHKNVRDSKDVKDFSKEIPEEGPAEEQPPAEGPPPALPFLRPSYLSLKLRRPVSNDIWMAAWHRALVRQPRPRYQSRPVI